MTKIPRERDTELNAYLGTICPHVPPMDVLHGMQLYKLLVFYDFPYVTINRTPMGLYFLFYYISTQLVPVCNRLNAKDGNFNYIATQISTEQIEGILSHKVEAKAIFDNPTYNIIYHVLLDHKGDIIQVSTIDLHTFKRLNPIKENI